MADYELQMAVEDALTKAFASKHPKARLAYMDLAAFFAGQIARQHGRADVREAIAKK